jgi:hypothetical protein
VTTTGCPTDQDLAAFTEGRLEGPPRDRVVAHLAGCSTCVRVVAAATELAGPIERRATTSWWLPAAAAVAASILLVVLWPRERVVPPATTAVAAPAWLQDAPWDARGDARSGFAAPSPARVAFDVGLHMGALDRACRDGQGQPIRDAVAASLARGPQKEWAARATRAEACGTGFDVPALLDPRLVELGRLLERWRIAAHEKEAVTAADLAKAEELARSDPGPAGRAVAELLRHLSAGQPPSADAQRVLSEAIAVLQS